MRYRIVVITGDTDDTSFQRLLRAVLRACTTFPSVAVRFEEYTDPTSNGADP